MPESFSGHPLITDDVVEAAVRAQRGRRGLILALDAALRVIEGEKPCERCEGSGEHRINGEWFADAPCPKCNGTGKVRTDRLVKMSEVVDAIRQHGWELDDYGQDAARFIEREFGGPGA